MASSGLDQQPGVEENISAFVAEHSELYKEQKAGDESASVEGCFPPPEIMPAKRVVECLALLSGLREEHAATTSGAKGRHSFAIFWVRDRPLYENLQGWDNEECLANLQTVADYMLLPKALNEALELEGAVIQARRDYQAAIGSYNLLTATDPKPRLFDFLVASAGLVAAFRRALKADDIDHVTSHVGDFLDYHIPGGYLEVSMNEGEDIPVRWAFIDGLTGESLSEYGYTPSTKRMLAYASGCILARRPVPAAAIPAEADAIKARADFYDTDFGRAALGPEEIAARVGDVTALKQFQERGWTFEQRMEKLLSAVGTSGSRDTLAWAHALNPEAFKEHAPLVLASILSVENRFDTAKWMVDTFDLHASLQAAAASYWWVTMSAAANNGLEVVQWLAGELRFPLSPAVVASACKRGNKELLDWYFSLFGPDDIASGRTWDWSAFSVGLLNGQRELTFSLLEKGTPEGELPDDILEVACEGCKGDTSVLDALVAIQPSLTSDVERLSLRASWMGYQNVLDWIARQPGKEGWLREPIEYGFQRAMEVALHHGQVESVRWLLNRVTKERLAQIVSRRRKKLCLSAVGISLAEIPTPSAEMLELLAPYYDLGAFYCTAIADTDIELVRRLNGMGCKLHVNDDDDLYSSDEDFSAHDDDDDEGEENDDEDQAGDAELAGAVAEGRGAGAVAEGQPEEANPPGEADAAAAHEAGGVDNGEAPAEEGGSARDEPFDKNAENYTLLDLIGTRLLVRPKCLSFLRSLKDECGFNAGTLSGSVWVAARSGSLELMKLVLELGGKLWPGALSEAGRAGHLPMCRWLRQQGVEWPYDMIERARQRGSDEVVAWVEEELAKERNAASGGNTARAGVVAS